MTMPVNRYGSITETIDELPENVPTALPEEFEEIGNILSIFAQFKSILEQYATEKDPLSKDLRKAGKTFMVFAGEKSVELQSLIKPKNDDNAENNNADFVMNEDIKRKIIEAYKEIIKKKREIEFVLKDPNNITLFVEPWLVENSVTWDKSTLDDFIELNKTYNKVVLATHHKFAQAAINWLDRWPKQISASPLMLPIVIASNGNELALPQEVKNYLRLVEYSKIISLTQDNIELKWQVQEKDLNIDELAKMVEFLIEANTEGMRQYEELLEKQAQSHLLQIDENDRMADSLRKDQTETVKNCTETNQVTQEMSSRTMAELVIAFKEIKSLNDSLDSAWRQIADCNAQIDDIRNNQGSSCSIQ